MSVWHHFKITALAKDKEAVAKFFNFDNPKEDVRGYGDRFELSFGGNYGPSLNIRKIVQQNPGLIFLINESIECDTEMWYVSRFDPTISDFRSFTIQDFGSVTNKVSKKALEEYDRANSGLVLKHLNAENGYENFHWSMHFNDFDKVADMLNRSEEYKEKVNPWKHFNVKTYVIEYEFRFGSDSEFHKEWQGPHPMNKINAIQDRLTKHASAGDLINVVIKEAEPR